MTTDNSCFTLPHNDNVMVWEDNDDKQLKDGMFLYCLLLLLLTKYSAIVLATTTIMMQCGMMTATYVWYFFKYCLLPFFYLLT